MSGTWEAPRSPLRVGCTNPIEGHPTGRGESDRSIVLRGGRSDHMGKGATGLRSLQRQHAAGLLDRGSHANLTAGNSLSVRKRAALRSPVREYRTPGSVRGRSGNRPSYLTYALVVPAFPLARNYGAVFE